MRPASINCTKYSKKCSPKNHKKISFKVFDIVNKNIDVLLILETKIDSSFPTAQFSACNTAPYR